MNSHSSGCTPSMLSITLTDSSPAAPTWKKNHPFENINSHKTRQNAYRYDLNSQLMQNQSSGCRLGRWAPGEGSESGPQSAAGLGLPLGTGTPLQHTTRQIWAIWLITGWEGDKIIEWKCGFTFRCRIFIQIPTLTPDAGVSPARAALRVGKVPCKKMQEVSFKATSCVDVQKVNGVENGTGRADTPHLASSSLCAQSGVKSHILSASTHGLFGGLGNSAKVLSSAWEEQKGIKRANA